MEKEGKFLPIGTVVLLKNGVKEVMITSYCIIPTGDVYNKDGKVESPAEIYDYGGCLYPEGILGADQSIMFNHEQIEKICYKGYVTDLQQELSEKINIGLKEMERQSKESQAQA